MKKKTLVLLLSALVFTQLFSCRKDAATDPVINAGINSEETTIVNGKKAYVMSLIKLGTGQEDCLVNSNPAYAGINLVSNPDLAASAWTYSGTPGVARDFIKFPGISYLPAGTNVVAATLTLYGMAPGTAVANPGGNSYYPGSPYNGSGTNACWVKRVLGSWDESTITWNNQPATTSANQAAVAASTSQWNYSTTVNVTALVQDIVNSGQNNGFSLQLQVENYYRNLNFSGHRKPDPATWPKLTITYTL
ncbi:DNRLRE domain-containing protein [Chitinophaga solisilvae]|uniref:DNRLRE domain-containing protein n=1 Tax=Chitinophaga solisilvae TaxID=1233460 RepID=A0A9Q5GU23_9BACT|nr:DNRLRE domain-containing protein [Chitinophaga solisilvae]NSL88834.1 DNRLRE domain-containing protein [Chitinophaga solisilvae]